MLVVGPRGQTDNLTGAFPVSHSLQSPVYRVEPRADAWKAGVAPYLYRNVVVIRKHVLPTRLADFALVGLFYGSVAERIIAPVLKTGDL